MSDDDLIRRGDAVAVLRKAQIASCTCQAKTPDPEWHLHGCRYRILREAEAMIDHVEPFDTAPMIDAAVAAALERAHRAAVLAGEQCAGASSSVVTDNICAAIRALAPAAGVGALKAARVEGMRAAMAEVVTLLRTYERIKNHHGVSAMTLAHNDIAALIQREDRG